MPRKKLPVGQIGTIRYEEVGYRRWRALAYVRTFADKRIRVTGTGRTKSDAEATLKANANDRVFENAGAIIDGNTTLQELLELTVKAMRAGTIGNKKLRIQSVNTYERQLSLFEGARGERAIGNLRLCECDKSIIANWLVKLSERTPANAKLAKILLSRAYDLTVVHGVNVWPINPTHGVKLRANDGEESEPVALSLAEIQQIWENVQSWQTPYKHTDLVGIVGALIATGFRPSEVLALQWSDFQLDAKPKAKATLSGAIVRQDGNLVRQGYTKTNSGFRTVTLPDWFRDMLIERLVNADNVLVFPNNRGGFLDIVNVRRQFREARGEVFSHVKFKSFRSSVATAIENVDGVEEAARQLGHASPAITGRYYVKRAADAGDHTAVLEMFAPAQSSQ